MAYKDKAAAKAAAHEAYLRLKEKRRTDPECKAKNAAYRTARYRARTEEQRLAANAKAREAWHKKHDGQPKKPYKRKPLTPEQEAIRLERKAAAESRKPENNRRYYEKNKRRINGERKEKRRLDKLLGVEEPNKEERTKRRAAQARARYAKNREKERLYRKTRRQNNIEAQRIYERAWDRRDREKNRDAINAATRAYRQSHREKFNAYYRQRRHAHIEEFREHRNKRRAASRDRFNEEARLRYQRNKHLGKSTHYNRARRARQRGAEGFHTTEDIRRIWDKQKYKCAVPGCTNPISDKRGCKDIFHIDHIQALINGGSNWPCNLQILCKRHNCEKNAQDEYRWAQKHLGKLFPM